MSHTYPEFIRLLPRDAMLARYMLSSCVCSSVCLSVRLSLGGIVLSRLAGSASYSIRRFAGYQDKKKRTDRAGFWRGCFFPPISHCYKAIHVYRKIRVLPSGTLSQTLELENFVMASRSCCQQNSYWRSSLLTTLAMVDAAWLDTHSLQQSVDYNTLSQFPSPKSVCCGYTVQRVPTVVQQLSRFRLTGRRAVRLQQ